MTEVCFGDSVKGALAVAQHCTGGAVGAVAFIGSEKLPRLHKQKLLRQMQAEQSQLASLEIPLGGGRDDLVGLGLGFDYGDIAAPLIGENCPCKKKIMDWLCADPWGELEDMQPAAEQYWKSCMDDLEKLKNRARRGDTLRVWVDNTPATRCGLLFAADALGDTDCSVQLVWLPEAWKRPDGVTVSFRSWGEVQPELFGLFAKNAEALHKTERQTLALQWKKLQTENAPLRTVEHGAVISVPADYYDGRIRAALPKEPCRVGELIGRSLANLPVSDWLVANRVRHFLQTGELKIVQKDEKRFYNTVIAAK